VEAKEIPPIEGKNNARLFCGILQMQIVGLTWQIDFGDRDNINIAGTKSLNEISTLRIFIQVELDAVTHMG
jgi:hypothetical protein